MEQLELDDEFYTVQLVCLEREMVMRPGPGGGVGVDGTVHYGTTGSYMTFHLGIRATPGYEDELERVWEHLAQPGIHRCCLPYGLGSSRDMQVYVTSARQLLGRMTREGNRWEEIRVTMEGAVPWRSPWQ